MADGAALLLDTCACLWLTHHGPIRAEARQRSPERRRVGESSSRRSRPGVASLARKGRHRLKVSVEAWFARLLALPGVRLAALDPGVLIASSNLPGQPLRDPADRMICATARARALAVVTRDKEMPAYGSAGFVSVVARAEVGWRRRRGEHGRQ
jgi:PIN domain nuclease of toxin-antitoxin system